jgi:hypothetical protein
MAMLVIFVVGILLFQAFQGSRILDDAFITYRYARNIANGNGYTYNPGEHVQGTTTPLFTLILALFSIFFTSNHIPDVSFYISVIADILNTWLLYRIGKHITRSETVGFFIALTFLLQPLRINVAKGGLETSLFILAMLAMYDFYILQNKTVVAAFFGACMILIRLDGLLPVIPIFLHACWKERTIAFKAFLVASLILLPWFAWAFYYFSNPLPFSIYAKTVTYQNYSQWETLTLLLSFLGTGSMGPYKDIHLIIPGLIAALFLVSIGIHWLWINNRVGILIVLYPIAYFTVMVIGHAPLFFSWYYPPLMPGIILAIFCGLIELISKSKIKEKYLFIPFSIGAAIFIVVPLIFINISPGWADSRDIESLYDQASKSIQQDALNKLVFSPDIGVIGWNLVDAKILDPIGLVSPQSLDKTIGENGDRNLQLINKYEPAYIFARDQFLYSLTTDEEFLQEYFPIWHGSSNNNFVTVFQRK